MDARSDNTLAQWLVWIQRLGAIAQNGLTYATNHFDRERYEDLRVITAEMLAQVGDAPVERVREILTGESGYMTPKVDVRGFVFKGDQVLLVREILDGRWTVPGGWADPGDTPGEAVLREIREESGYEARIVKLAAVHDRTRQGHTPPLPFAVYKLLFLCELTGGEARTSDETDGVGFFPIADLPPLSLGRVLPGQITRLHRHGQHRDWPTDVD